VHGVHGRLWGYYFDPLAGANYTLVVPAEHQPGRGEVSIGQGISRTLQAFSGDLFPFRAYDGNLLAFTIRDVLSSDSELASSDLILIGEPDFRKLFRIPPGFFTDFTVQVRNTKEVQTIAGKIARLLPDTRPITKREIMRTYDSVFDWRSGLIVVLLSAAVLAFVIFAWDKASGLSAEERREIGILKAIGWETQDVLLMKFWEGTVLSLSSFLTGVLLAYIHVFFTPVALFEPVLKGWSTLYPGFRLVPFINPYQMAVLFFLTVVPYTVSTIVPSWRAATVDPDSVMRS
jgi:ABC-type lipoprotein release transport system permease subunit